jgi:hypothetical protein
MEILIRLLLYQPILFIIPRHTTLQLYTIHNTPVTNFVIASLDRNTKYCVGVTLKIRAVDVRGVVLISHDGSVIFGTMVEP